MYKTKRFSYTYEDYADGNKTVEMLMQAIVDDKDFPELEEIVIGCWGEAWDEDEEGAQFIVDYIVEHADKFSHIKSLFVGDMDYEECEVSWIIQADYSKLWDAMPQLEKITIKGSTGLELGLKEHAKLSSLEIICGGLPAEVIGEIQDAKLPKLEMLLLYLGVEDYGFDGDISTIKNLLDKSDFPKLKYLGLTDSEIQDEVAEAALQSQYGSRISILDLSNGTLTDKGGEILLRELPNHLNITVLDLQYHYLSDEMMEKLDKMAEERGSLVLTMDDQQEADEYDGEFYTYPMLTE